MIDYDAFRQFVGDNDLDDFSLGLDRSGSAGNGALDMLANAAVAAAPARPPFDPVDAHLHDLFNAPILPDAGRFGQGRVHVLRPALPQQPQPQPRGIPVGIIAPPVAAAAAVQRQQPAVAAARPAAKPKNVINKKWKHQVELLDRDANNPNALNKYIGNAELRDARNDEIWNRDGVPPEQRKYHVDRAPVIAAIQRREALRREGQQYR
jgi:hypothetical protein